jgi:hypothetical protein
MQVRVSTAGACSAFLYRSFLRAVPALSRDRELLEQECSYSACTFCVLNEFPNKNQLVRQHATSKGGAASAQDEHAGDS